MTTLELLRRRRPWAAILALRARGYVVVDDPRGFLLIRRRHPN